jgi:hypothetical protein
MFYTKSVINRKGGIMVIRKMEERDIAGVNKLLKQVNKIHHDGRPDLFRLANKVYR